MASSHYSLDLWGALTIIVDSFLPMLNINTFTELANSVIIYLTLQHHHFHHNLGGESELWKPG